MKILFRSVVPAIQQPTGKIHQLPRPPAKTANAPASSPSRSSPCHGCLQHFYSCSGCELDS